MAISRLDLKGVNKAIDSLASLATPQSQLKLATRGASSQDRYLWVALQDGRWLAIDRAQDNKAYIMSKRSLPASPGVPLVVELQGGDLGMLESYHAYSLHQMAAPDGDYQLQRSGKVQIKAGKVASVVGTPSALAAISVSP